MPRYSRSGRTADRALIAAYLEGGLDASSARAVASIVQTEPDWAAEFERQKRVKEALAAAPQPDAPAACERVWNRLVLSAANPAPLWRRRITIPVPLALGAAALLLLLAFGLVHTAARGSIGTMRITTVPNGLKQVQIQAPLADLQQLLRSIETDASSREVIISLPEDSQMFSVGEPVLMRATELERRLFK